jgi:uncharacterized protein (TIGR03792 family)
MDIEYLRFRVDPAQREIFIEQDACIWSSVLEGYPGYLGKEIWINPEDDSEVIVLVRWRSFEEWQAVPPEILQEAETRFQQTMGDTYELLDSRRYQVRRFPTSDSAVRNA